MAGERLTVVNVLSLLVCGAVLARFAHTTYDYSSELLAMNENFRQLPSLSRGWLVPGRQVDHSDHQLRVFLASLPGLALLVPVWCLLARAGRKYLFSGSLSEATISVERVDFAPWEGGGAAGNGGGKSFGKQVEDLVVVEDGKVVDDDDGQEKTARRRKENGASASGESAGDTHEGAEKATAELARRAAAGYYCGAGLVFAFLAMGVPGMYTWAWVVLNHALVRILAGPRGRHWFPWLVWVLNLAFLVGSDYTRGFDGVATGVVGDRIAVLLDYRGAVRWQVYSRFVSLRCISYAVDAHWALLERADGRPPVPRDDARVSRKPLYYRLQELPRPLHEYGLREALAFVFYPPLFLAGPIASFNAFAGQLDPRNRPLSTRRNTVGSVLGMLRLAFYVAALELYLHFNYSNAIVHDGQYEYFTGWECWCLQYSQLKGTMWLKFLIIWRFFRLWAALDGFESPVNMERCMSNNQTFTGFWRSWHASFNIFNIRYLFVPLGGRRRQVPLVWLIFIFVALWHDLSMQWLAWGVYNAAFLSLEVVAMRLLGPTVQRLPGARFITAFLSTFSIAALMFSNMAIQLGFTETLEFTRVMYFNGWANGLEAFAMTSVYYTAAALLMRTTRETERLSDDQVQKKRT